MIVKMECNYSSEESQSISTTLYYRYQLNNVTDEDVQKPNLDGYNVNQLQKKITKDKKVRRIGL